MHGFFYAPNVHLDFCGWEKKRRDAPIGGREAWFACVGKVRRISRTAICQGNPASLARAPNWAKTNPPRISSQAQAVTDIRRRSRTQAAAGLPRRYAAPAVEPGRIFCAFATVMHGQSPVLGQIPVGNVAPAREVNLCSYRSPAPARATAEVEAGVCSSVSRVVAPRFGGVKQPVDPGRPSAPGPPGWGEPK